MAEKWKTLIFLLCLGGIFPALVFSMVDGKNARNLNIEKVDEQPQVEIIEDTAITVPVLQSDGKIINLSMDEYLTCVLLCEMPANFELEALKAQAVVARTYTLRRYVTARKHDDAAVCTDPSCCQGFTDIKDYLAAGASQESVNRIRQAVEATTDLVLVYDGKLIEATYFSCSGGMTEDAAAVWGADIPYLQATESPGEEIATHYTDTVTFSSSEFQTLLGRKLSGSPAKWMEEVTYTDGGGVATMRISGITYKGTTLRQLLGLRSTAFIMTAVGETISVTTKGFGHRVGMSQYGAEAMAVNGSSFNQILAHYYTGTQLVSYSADVIDKG